MGRKEGRRYNDQICVKSSQALTSALYYTLPTTFKAKLCCTVSQGVY